MQLVPEGFSASRIVREFSREIQKIQVSERRQLLTQTKI